MQFSTTPTLEGQSIVEYCGVVTGEAILGANIFFQAEDGIRDKTARPFRLFSRLFPIYMSSLAAGHKLLWIQVTQLLQHLVGVKAVHMAVD